MNIQIFGDGALAHEIKYGLFAKSYSGVTFDTVTCLGDSDSADDISKSVLGMQDPFIKRKVFESLSPFVQSKFIRLVHSTAIIFSGVEIGLGAIVNANSVLSFDTELGLKVLVNWNVTIGHQVKIGNHTSIGPGSSISGEAQIGEGCLLGAGVIVNPGVRIGDGVRIGAGAVVTKNVASNITVVGIPARQTAKKGE
jgi:sugar O-acyltransferase (sialic acid O-acetyltransferase NeuD family)